MQPLFLMGDDANSVNDDAWYMNRIDQSGVAKTPTHLPQGGKQRLMADILGISCKSQCNAVAARRETSSYGCSQISTSNIKPWAQLFNGNDEEMETMTLRDMQLSLKKAARRSVNKETCMEPSCYLHPCNGSGTSLNVHSGTPSVGLELLWEDSTSNSSDNAPFGKGISPVWDTSPEQLHKVDAQITEAGDATDLRSGQKRPSLESVAVLETEVAEDDDWTLQKWQLRLKQGYCRKRLKKLSKFEQDSSRSEDGAHDAILEIDRTHSERIQDTYSVKLCKTDGIVCQPADGKAPCSNGMSSSQGAVQGDSSHRATSPLSLSVVRLELEDEFELATMGGLLPERSNMSNKVVWALQPCSKVRPAPISKLASASTHARAGLKPILQTSSRKSSNLSGVQASGAWMPLPRQRKQSMVAAVGSDTSGSIPFDPKQLRTTIPMDGSEIVCKSKLVTSEVARQSDVDQLYSSSSTSLTSNALEGAAPLQHSVDSKLPLEHSVDTKLPQQVHSCDSQACRMEFSDVLSTLDSTESLEIEEGQELQREPAKIPCKRKAISPMSQEFLLKASKLGGCGANAESKGSKGWIDLTKLKRSKLRTGAAASFGWGGQTEELLQGSGCYMKVKEALSEAFPINALLVTPAEKIVAESAIISHAHVQAGILISPAEPQSSSKATNTESPAGSNPSNPSNPSKGILRSSSQGCQGPCICEECASLRSRAERAAEFSQRQMLDIEGLAVKLMKDLSILRNIVEDRLIQSPSRHQGPRPNLSLEQLKKATGNALETEETAKKWLVRMARDSNRYCKIMRMQGRKLTFADESGGKLCQVKVFHSETVQNATMGVNERPLEVNCGASPEQSKPSVEVA